jgi:hypothetical protein
VDETRVQREKNIDLPQVTNTFNNITVIWWQPYMWREPDYTEKKTTDLQAKTKYLFS